MALVFVCLGQCGNQLAVSVFDTVLSSISGPHLSSESMRLQTLRRFFREPAAGFESGDSSRPHAAGSSSRDDLVSAKPSTGQALSKLDAALGLAHRVRSKSATPRVSPYSQPVKKAIIARDKKKPVVPVAPRKKWVTESPASGPDQPPAAAAGKSPVAGAPVPSEGEAIASVPLPLLVARAVLIDMEPKVSVQLRWTCCSHIIAHHPACLFACAIITGHPRLLRCR